jgi:hypothetical protein
MAHLPSTLSTAALALTVEPIARCLFKGNGSLLPLIQNEPSGDGLPGLSKLSRAKRGGESDLCG